MRLLSTLRSIEQQLLCSSVKKKAQQRTFLEAVNMSPTPADCLAVAIVPTCAATLAVALRFYVRVRRGVGVGRDDWTSLVALVWSSTLPALHAFRITMADNIVNRH